MIPLHDTNPTRGTPVVNRVLLLANVVVWIYTVSLMGSPAALNAFYETYAFDWEALVAAFGRGDVAAERVVPLFTHMFLHGGWLHVIGNMLYLWIFGDNVEDRLGPGMYLLFYLGCGIAAAIGQGLVAAAPMVGASGAVAGVLGAYIVMFPGARISTLIFLGIFISVIQLPALVIIGLWVVIQVLSGFGELRLDAAEATQQVAYFAHIVGFVVGVALLLAIRRRREPRRLRYG